MTTASGAECRCTSRYTRNSQGLCLTLFISKFIICFYQIHITACTMKTLQWKSLGQHQEQISVSFSGFWKPPLLRRRSLHYLTCLKSGQALIDLFPVLCVICTLVSNWRTSCYEMHAIPFVAWECEEKDNVFLYWKKFIYSLTFMHSVSM